MPSAAADPAYLAYLRAIGVQESELGNVAALRVNSLTRQLGRGLPGYAEQRERAVRQTGEGFEDRGVFRSGLRQVRQADAGREVDRARNDFEAGIRDQISGTYATSASDIAALRRQLAEQGMNSAQTVALNNANSGIY